MRACVLRGPRETPHRAAALLLLLRCIIRPPTLSRLTTHTPTQTQSMSKSSKMLNYINYRMRVTIQDK